VTHNTRERARPGVCARVLLRLSGPPLLLSRRPNRVSPLGRSRQAGSPRIASNGAGRSQHANPTPHTHTLLFLPTRARSYALLIWIIRLNPIKLCGLQAPDKQAFPKTSMGDLIKTLPVGFCSAAAHSSSVFALGGDPLFGQIVKAGEPVISAVVNTIFYGKPPTMLKAFCLPIIVGGVAFASLKKGDDGAYALKFDQTALIFGMMANGFAAFKGSENKKLMDDKDLKSRFGGVGNQFAVTEVLAFIWSLPVMFAVEGDKFSEFLNIFMVRCPPPPAPAATHLAAAHP